MRTTLNHLLLSTLPRVLRMTHAEIADTCSLAIATWYRITREPQKITVQQLLALANGLHVPIRKFFTIGKTNVIGVREDYVVTDGYQKCYYDSDAITKVIGNGAATSWKDAARAVGMHWTNVTASLMAVHRTPVTRLLSLCEAFHWEPFDFLIDPNEVTANRSRKKRMGPGAKEVPTVEALRAEILELKADVARTLSIIQQLQEKYDTLLEAHNTLARRVSVTIHSVKDSNLSIAAEGEGSYTRGLVPSDSPEGKTRGKTARH